MTVSCNLLKGHNMKEIVEIGARSAHQILKSPAARRGVVAVAFGSLVIFFYKGYSLQGSFTDPNGVRLDFNLKPAGSTA